MRAVIYARYSSELQRDASIEDQVRVCKAYIKHEGWQLVATYTDRALSGTSHLRPGYQKLVEDARNGELDVVVAEALDRLSRDQEHVAAFFKQLTFAGVRIVTLGEGEISELHVGLKGTMNALFLKDLAAKIRRGQLGRLSIGRSPGGLSYGYEVVRDYGVDGEPDRGKRRIDQQAAILIRRIFKAYVSGMSPRAIASQLNAEGVPAPRGGSWNASTINGNRRRRDGILWNELYIGRLIYNRQRFVKDPESGRRVPKPNPRRDWVVVEVPELQIIDQALWDQAQTLKAHNTGQKPHNCRRPRRLLSGLMRCGACGGAYTVIGQERIGCAVHREKGMCSNSKTTTLAKIENRVLSGLKERLLDPELIAEFAREYQLEFNKRQRDAVRRNSRSVSELRAVEDRIARIVDAIEQGADVTKLRERLMELEQKRIELKHTLSQIGAEDAIIQIRPDLSNLYRRKVAELRESLKWQCGDASGGDCHPQNTDRQDRLASGRKTRRFEDRTSRPTCLHHKSSPAMEAGRRCYDNDGSGGGIRTPDTRIMIPLL